MGYTAINSSIYQFTTVMQSDKASKELLVLYSSSHE